jgi:hypothetical protein
VRCALFEGGEDQHFQMAAEFIALNRFHAQIIDRLYIKSKRSVHET